MNSENLEMRNWNKSVISRCRKCGLSGLGMALDPLVGLVRMKRHEATCSGDRRKEYLRRKQELARKGRSTG